MALDRWALARTAELQQEIVAAYAAYEFHRVYQQLQNFCAVDLGAFYLDVIKDRLYTTPQGATARRSAQTAMWHIAEAMARWLAPILSFTAEEIWELPARPAGRVGASFPPGTNCRQSPRGALTGRACSVSASWRPAPWRSNT